MSSINTKISTPEPSLKIPNISYPISKANGEEFIDSEELLAHLSAETSGRYLVSQTGYWHGGIHISSQTTPWSALAGNAENENRERHTGLKPIRCMMDGEIIAYRVNLRYGKTEFENNDFYFSSSFVLVKHRYQVGSQTESGIEFYSLYMHLAPYDAYEDGLQSETETLYRVVANKLSIYRSILDIQQQRLDVILAGTEILVNNLEPEFIHPASGRKYKQVRLANQKDISNNKNWGSFWLLSDRGEDNITRVTSNAIISPWLKTLIEAEVQKPKNTNNRTLNIPSQQERNPTTEKQKPNHNVLNYNLSKDTNPHSDILNGQTSSYQQSLLIQEYRYQILKVDGLDCYSLSLQEGRERLYYAIYSDGINYEEATISLLWDCMLPPGTEFTSVIPIHKVPQTHSIAIHLSVPNRNGKRLVYIKPAQSGSFKSISQSKPTMNESLDDAKAEQPTISTVNNASKTETFAGFDKVVVMQQPLPIKAGDAIGHMGLVQEPLNHLQSNRYLVHLELFSTDENFELFIQSKDKLTQKERDRTFRYVKYQKSKPITRYHYNPVTESMTSYDEKTRSSGIIDIHKCDKKSLANQDEKNPTLTLYYYSETENAYLSENELMRLSQYDFEELGYALLESDEQNFFAIDVTGQKVPSRLVGHIFKRLEVYLSEYHTKFLQWWKNSILEKLYSQIANSIELNKTHHNAFQYLEYLHSYQSQEVLAMLLVRHPSEWFYDYDSTIWQTTDQAIIQLDKSFASGKRKQIEQLIWMKDVPAFNTGKPIWHMHPIMFLERLKWFDIQKITYAQLKNIFPKASEQDIFIVIRELNGRLEEFKLDTPTGLCHFFSQIKGEVGEEMKGKTESFQFSPETLLKFSKYYEIRPNEAIQDGYLRVGNKIIRRADEQAIGRKHYLRLNGNRQSHPDDGYIFRGRGLIQITGYEKYSTFPAEYNQYWADTAPDTVNNPEIVNQMPYAIRSAIWFWLYKKVYTADLGGGYADVKNITHKVNGGYNALAERQDAYQLCEKVFL